MRQGRRLGPQDRAIALGLGWAAGAIVVWAAWRCGVPLGWRAAAGFLTAFAVGLGAAWWPLGRG